MSIKYYCDVCGDCARRAIAQMLGLPKQEGCADDSEA